MTMRRKTKRGSFRRERKGVTAVEFAFAAPALFLMIFICAEFARLMMLRDVAHTAAYEAARFVIVEGATNQDAIDAANKILDRLGTQGATIDVNNGQQIEFKTEDVTVTVTIPMNQNTLILPTAYGDKSIEAVITLSTERYTGYFNADDVN